MLAMLFSFFVKDNSVKTDSPPKSYLSELKAGFAFIRKGIMLPLVVVSLLIGLFASIAYVNLPAFAEYHIGSADGYILLTALSLVGGAIGSYIIRAISHAFAIWKILIAAFILAGIARIIFVHIIATDFTSSIWIYILYIGSSATIGVIFQALMQKLPPKTIIARIDTITTSLYGIIAAIGSFIGGILGTILENINTTFIIQGASYIILALILYLSKHVRSLTKIQNINEKSDASSI